MRCSCSRKWMHPGTRPNWNRLWRWRKKRWRWRSSWATSAGRCTRWSRSPGCGFAERPGVAGTGRAGVRTEPPTRRPCGCKSASCWGSAMPSAWTTCNAARSICRGLGDLPTAGGQGNRSAAAGRAQPAVRAERRLPPPVGRVRGEAGQALSGGRQPAGRRSRGHVLRPDHRDLPGRQRGRVGALQEAWRNGRKPPTSSSRCCASRRSRQRWASSMRRGPRSSRRAPSASG